MNHRKLRFFSPPVVAVIAAAIVMFVTLFLPSCVGMADNGDFYRIINGNGIYKLDRNEPDQYLQYFSREFSVYQYYNEYEDSVLSSQTPFIRAAMALDRLFTGDDSLFDVRFLALLLALLALLALYLLVEYVSKDLNRREGYLAAALSVFLFADTGYIAYFNSFYAEGLVLVCFLLAMTSTLLLEQHRYNPYLLLSLYTVSGVTLTFAKQQNVPLGVLMGILGGIIAFRYFAQERRLATIQSSDGILLAPIATPNQAVLPLQDNRETKQKKKLFSLFHHKSKPTDPNAAPQPHRFFRRICLSCSMLLILLGLASYVLIPQEFVNINKYHAMTRGILMTSKNPEEALKQFGINPQYSLLDRSIYYERYPTADVSGHELTTQFYPKYGFVSVAAYYIGHPAELMQMLDYSARNAYSIRPAVMGNYQRDAGKEAGQKSYIFALYSSLKQAFTPRTVGYMLIWIALALVIGLRDRGRTIVLGFAILMGLSQIGVSIIGAGDADLSKHIFLYNVAYDFTNFILISTVMLKKISNRKKKPTRIGAVL